jgi:hypothetical protein
VEEYHPGADYTCSHYLPQAAKLEIGYCYGKTKYLAVDQSRNGGKWNKIAKLPFFKGQKGYFKLSNHKQDQCSASDCFWVADAFRATWIGVSCKSSSIEADASKEESSSMEASSGPSTTSMKAEEKGSRGTSLAMEVNDEVGSHQAQGILSLVVTADESSADLKLQIQNLGVLEAGIKAQFGYESVDLFSVDVSSQRRLSSGLGGSPRVVDAVFVGKGSGEHSDDELSLTERLQVLFDESDSGILVKSASVSWDTSSTGQPVDTQAPDPNLVTVGLVWLLAFVALLLALSALYTAKKKTKVAECDVKKEADEDPGQAMECKDESSKEPKAESKEFNEDNLDLVSVSTAPPASDTDVSSETGSVVLTSTN